MPAVARTTVVIATRDRAAVLCETLEHLLRLPECPAITVVDNASTDATRERVAFDYPSVRLIALPDDRGATARAVGAAAAKSPYVAFCGDDSWWAAGSLQAATRQLAKRPRLALVAARSVTEPSGTPDPVTEQMAASPLPREPGLPGPAVLGFPACGAVVRREAYLGVGGFHPLLFRGGQERLLAYDLAAAGWELTYLEDVVAHHRPVPVRDPAGRRALDLRNRALIGWLRRPLRSALRVSRQLARNATVEPAAHPALRSLTASLPRALKERRMLPREVEAKVHLLEEFERHNPEVVAR
jgi:GT2 family glycosyltransferase